MVVSKGIFKIYFSFVVFSQKWYISERVWAGRDNKILAAECLHSSQMCSSFKTAYHQGDPHEHMATL